MKKLAQNNNYQKLRRIFFYALPSVLYFSFYPLILLGSDSRMNFELSLPLIWTFLFAIISFPGIVFFLKENKSKKATIFISLLFPLYSTLSILWTKNLIRAILTAGVIWCIWISVVSIIDIIKNTKSLKTMKSTFLKVFFISTIIVCVFCWAQCFLDVLNISREITLLCAGCTNYSFGFPHPSGFAIEPQFMGNLLLAPIFLSFYLLFKQKQKNKPLVLSALFFLATLFLTMSRGAIYAFIVGTFVFLFLEIKNTKSTKPLIIIPMIILSFFFTLIFQGIFAELSPTNDTFGSGISKVISQMSLGKIEIPYKLKTENNVEESDKEENSSQFDGYAEVSTTTRLELSKLAFRAWVNSPETFIIGVGLGSAGKAMHAIAPDMVGEKEIVQNEILEIALELGLIGAIILLISLAMLTKVILNSGLKTLLLPLLISYFITYFFFSGLPNALHVFLLPACFVTGSINKKF